MIAGIKREEMCSHGLELKFAQGTDLAKGMSYIHGYCRLRQVKRATVAECSAMFGVEMARNMQRRHDISRENLGLHYMFLEEA